MDRVPTLRSIHHVGISVPDLEQALHFWCGVLGFRVVKRSLRVGEYAERLLQVPGGAVSSALIDTGKQLIELVEYHDVPARRSALASHWQVGTAHIAFEVEDIDKSVATLSRQGWLFLGEPLEVPNGPDAGMRSVFARSAEGQLFELFQPPPVRTQPVADSAHPAL